MSSIARKKRLQQEPQKISWFYRCRHRWSRGIRGDHRHRRRSSWRWYYRLHRNRCSCDRRCRSRQSSASCPNQNRRNRCVFQSHSRWSSACCRWSRCRCRRRSVGYRCHSSRCNCHNPCLRRTCNPACHRRSRKNSGVRFCRRHRRRNRRIPASHPLRRMSRSGWCWCGWLPWVWPLPGRLPGA